MTFMPWKTILLLAQLLLSFAWIKGLLFIAPGIYGYLSCLDLFGDNFSPAPQRAWKSQLWKKILLISTNRFKSLIFSCLCVYSTGPQIYVKGNVISEYSSLKQLYIMKMEAEKAKFSDAAFKWGKTCLAMWSKQNPPAWCCLPQLRPVLRSTGWGEGQARSRTMRQGGGSSQSQLSRSWMHEGSS